MLCKSEWLSANSDACASMLVKRGMLDFIIRIQGSPLLPVICLTCPKGTKQGEREREGKQEKYRWEQRDSETHKG